MPLPDEIGGYRVERLLGRGGMAAVYLARGADGSRVSISTFFALMRPATDGYRGSTPPSFTVATHGGDSR